MCFLHVDCYTSLACLLVHLVSSRFIVVPRIEQNRIERTNEQNFQPPFQKFSSSCCCSSSSVSNLHSFTCSLSLLEASYLVLGCKLSAPRRAEQGQAKWGGDADAERKEILSRPFEGFSSWSGCLVLEVCCLVAVVMVVLQWQFCQQIIKSE